MDVFTWNPRTFSPAAFPSSSVDKQAPAAVFRLRLVCKNRTTVLDTKRPSACLSISVDIRRRIAAGTYHGPWAGGCAPHGERRPPAGSCLRLRKIRISLRNSSFKTKLTGAADAVFRGIRPSCANREYNLNRTSGKPMQEGSPMRAEGKGFRGEYEMVQGRSRLQRKRTHGSTVLQPCLHPPAEGRDRVPRA